MIDVDRFDIRSLWRQLLADFELDHLDDAKEVICAIRSHPQYTSAYEPWFHNLLSNLLCDSLQNANLEWATYLLRRGAQVMNEAAGHAVCRGFSDDEKLELLDAFYENGWDVDSTDENSIPIFCHAADSELLVLWFLSHGANPNISDPNGLSPIDRAAACGNYACVQLLLENGARLTTNVALHNAARRRSPDCIVLPILSLLLGQYVVALDVFLLESDAGGRPRGSPLHGAVESGSAERVRLLLEKGADPRTENATGQTPLELARLYGFFETERVLLEWLGRQGEEARETWVLVDDFEVLAIDSANPSGP